MADLNRTRVSRALPSNIVAMRVSAAESMAARDDPNQFARVASWVTTGAKDRQ